MIKLVLKFNFKKIKNMKTKKILFGMMLALFFFSSCNNDSKDNASDLTAEETDVNAKIDMITDDVSKIVEDQLTSQINGGGRMLLPGRFLPDCVTLTNTIVGSTWTRTVDFGTTGCELKNGNILKGKIIVSGSIDLNKTALTINYSFVDFYHNAKLIKGNKTVVISQKSTSTNQIHPVATMTLDMTVTFPNGNVYTRVGTRIREMVEGIDTPSVWLDNVFLITGNWTTTLPNGSTQTSTITTPLKIRMNCNYIVSGVLAFTRNNNTAILDYGIDNGCDNQATATINGVTYPITL